jgi:hypothetical protein
MCYVMAIGEYMGMTFFCCFFTVHYLLLLIATGSTRLIVATGAQLGS